MIKIKRVDEVCAQFKKKRILIFGDVILDRYIFGNANRISPEAPVPVVKLEKEEFRLGGAGNVSANIKKMGATSFLFAITGKDLYGEEILKLTGSKNNIVKSETNKTLVKTRIISGRQQIVRIDREDKIQITPEIEDTIFKQIKDLKVHGIIVSDYAKGSLTKSIMDFLNHKAKSDKIPIIVDPKPPNFKLYTNIDGITPNLKEAEEITNKKIINNTDAYSAIKYIRKKFKSNFSIITRGDKGISAGAYGKKVFHLPAFGHEVYDVTGAGDTVVAVLSLSLISGSTLREAVSLANVAASIVIERIGTSQTTVDEIKKRIKFLLKTSYILS